MSVVEMPEDNFKFWQAVLTEVEKKYPELVAETPANIGDQSALWIFTSAAREVGRREMCLALAVSETELPAVFQESLATAMRSLVKEKIFG